ncbi:hypothetical protein NIES932_08020 [Raphidiopsis curvata NIES-932]|nr:hypothetical protein NIES932_08020 [Raphidiopsis curvata NIES-932]
MKPIGDTTFKIITDKLRAFSLSDKFWESIDTAFGTSYNRTIAEVLRGKWQKGEFSDLPPIEIVDNAILNGGKGAYSQKKNRIYLSSNLISNIEAINKVIIEEIGHYVDAQINQVDSPGDEGEIFAALYTIGTQTEQYASTVIVDNDFPVITVAATDAAAGEVTGGTVDADIDAPEAWNIENRMI